MSGSLFLKVIAKSVFRLSLTLSVCPVLTWCMLCSAFNHPSLCDLYQGHSTGTAWVAGRRKSAYIPTSTVTMLDHAGANSGLRSLDFTQLAFFPSIYWPCACGGKKRPLRLLCSYSPTDWVLNLFTVKDFQGHPSVWIVPNLWLSQIMTWRPVRLDL